MTDIQIRLPRPHAKQRAILDSPAKRKVVSAGRRFGKTTLATLSSVPSFLNGERVLLSSTSQDQSDVFWRYATRWLQPLTDRGVVYKNETRRILRMGDAELRVKTGSDPDALRGDGVSKLVLDEAAYLKPHAWSQVGAPMLADTDGVAMFISTPKRRNHFFQWFQRGLADDTGRWASWHGTTFDNPHLSRHAVAELIGDMTEDDYQQEIMAEFLENAGAVFRYVDQRCTAPRAQPYAGDFVMGVDWAQQQDYTALVVIDRDTNTMVDMDRFNGVDWALQRGRLRSMADKWGVRTIVAETNSIGSPNIEALQREGLPVTGFTTTAQTKPPLIESLVLAFDRGEITCLDDEVLKGELMAYERTVGSTGRSQYSAPEGLHDDTVIALALAWKYVSTRLGSIVVA